MGRGAYAGGADNAVVPPVSIRPAIETDAPRIAEIYAHHVLHGVATFEEIPPEPEEMARRMREIRAAGYPWLVAEEGGQIVGFAYAGVHKARAAYRYTVEDSIYLAADRLGRGIGSALLGRLIEVCDDGGFARMIAIIGGGENAASIALHRKHGFEVTGRVDGIGFKFGRFVDVVYMIRALSGEPNRSGVR